MIPESPLIRYTDVLYKALDTKFPNYQMNDSAPQQFCEVDVYEHVLLVTINRPKARNALHPPASHELAEVFRSFQANPDLRVAIITGKGSDAFCAGNDLKFSATASLQEMKLPDEGFGGLTSFRARSKPVIAAVNGAAYGGGFEIALAADIILASESAKFALPEVKVGMAALGGGIHRLAEQIPYKKAVEMLITGQSVDAQEGHRLGFVNQVCAPDQLLDAAMSKASQIAQCSPVSIDVTLTALQNGRDQLPQAELQKLDYSLAKKIFKSQDFIEGAKAFAEKRPPKWPGK